MTTATPTTLPGLKSEQFVTIDTLAPVVSASLTRATMGPNQLNRGDASHVGAGGSIDLTIQSIQDANLVAGGVQLNTSEIETSSTAPLTRALTAPYAQTINFPVKDSRDAGAVRIVSSNARAYVFAYDLAGNKVEQPIGPLHIDNEVPTAPISITGGEVDRMAAGINNVPPASITVKPTFTLPTGANAARIFIGGSPTTLPLATPGSSFDIPVVPNGITHDPVVTLQPIDVVGNFNPSVVSNAFSPPLLGSVTYAGGAMKPSIKPDGLDTVAVTIARGAPTGLVADHEDVYVQLELENKGFYIEGTTGNLDEHYATSGTSDRILRSTSVTPGAAPVAFFNQLASTTLKDGQYFLHVHVEGPDGTLLQKIPFRVDSGIPTLTGIDGTGDPRFDPTNTIGEGIRHDDDGNRVDLTFRTTELATGSGLKNLTVEVVHADESGVALQTDGTLAQESFTPTSCTGLNCLSAPQATYSIGQVHFSATRMEGNLSFTFPGLAPGDYRLRVYVQDEAGNGRAYVSPPDATQLYSVAPRAELVTSGGYPFASSTRIFMAGLAGMDVPESLQTAGEHLCEEAAPGQPETACRVTSVEFRARNLEADGTPTSENGALLSFAFSDAFTPRVDPPLTPALFNHSNPLGYTYPTGVVATKRVQVMMKATANVGGAEYVSETGWISANSLTLPALNAVNPPVGWKFNTTGRMDYNVSFDLKVASDTSPTLGYTLSRIAPGHTLVEVDKLPQLRQPNATEEPTGTVSFFNGTFDDGGPLADGEYVVTFEAWHAGVLKATLTRHFAVSTIEPEIVFEAQPANANQHRGDGNKFDVGPAFNLSFKVNHGLLNITGDSAFTFALRDAQGRWHPNGSASGFGVIIRSHSPYEDTRRAFTNVVATVTLPSSATSGDTFNLVINATTDGLWLAPNDDNPDGIPADARLYRASVTASLRLDKTPPVAIVDHAATNASGDGAQILIRGHAQDAASGVKTVEVRIMDMTRNRTLLWLDGNAPIFADGESNSAASWATSDLVSLDGGRFIRNVWYNPATGAWQINQTHRPVLDEHGDPVSPASAFRSLTELDFETVYRIDVRARDHLGFLSGVTNATVRFDTQAPLIAGVAEGSGITFSGNPLQVGWHGQPNDGRFIVNVTDNRCIERVSLRGIGPAGEPVGPVDLVPFNASQASCADYPHGAGVDWTTTLRESPALTDLVGEYRYYVEAEDASGHVARGSTSSFMTFAMKVLDTQPPVIRYVNMDPALIGERTTSVVRAEIFENAAIGKVEVFVSQIIPGGSVTPVGNGTLRPFGTPAANGTGLYVANLGSDLDLALLRGDYLLQVRASDAAGSCGPTGTPCAFSSSILVVSDSAPPAISAALGAKPYVNATTVLRYEVTDLAIQPSGVQVRAGNSTENLTTVNVNITPLLTGVGNARTGLKVEYAPQGLVSGEPLVVEVKATTNLTATRVFNYTVDVTPPVVTHNVTGLATVGERQWVVSGTRVSLSASDVNGSGVAAITYALNGASAFAPYAGALTPTGRQGTWRLDYVATDNASNVARGSVVLDLDGNGPNVTMSRHGDDVMIIVTDAGSGLDEGNVTVHYAYGDAPMASKKMERATGTANAYTASLGGDAASEGLRYWFEAKDRLGNKGFLYSEASPHVIDKESTPGNNRAPTVAITAPVSGLSVRTSVELRWTAVDPDGDALRATIGLRDARNPNGRALAEDVPDTGRYTLNLSGYAAGTYTFTLVVSDGNATSAVQTRAFVVERGESITPISYPEDKVQPGAEAKFAVQISPTGNKTVRTAGFTVTRDGTPYSSGTLKLEGGYYVGAVTPTEPGEYQVEVLVSYSDGTQDQSRQVAKFSVLAAPVEAAMPMAFVALLAVAMLTVALAAWGAFGRWK